MPSCEKCTADNCDVMRAIRDWIGVWARERRRQGIFGLDPVAIPDPEAMEAAVGPAWAKIRQAKCDCACHDFM